MRIIIISAIAQNGVIGKSNGEMPWHEKEEFQHFKQTTFGFPVIMGRKTFETLGKPLKGRENIVVTRNENFKLDFEGTKVINSLKDAVEYCRLKNSEKAFIIGGGEIYNQALLFADEMILSFMKFEVEGDVKFPHINYNSWKVVSKEDREKFEIKRFVRKDAETN